MTATKTKISVITVCRNAEATIEKTVASVLRQKKVGIEYIVIDGNSTDNTVKILEKYQHGIDLLISEDDKGIYDAMNKGIERANGELIGILNADDWYEDGVLEVLLNQETQWKDADIVAGSIRRVDPVRGSEKIIMRSEVGTLGAANPSVLHPGTFVKKELYRSAGLYDRRYSISADYEFFCRARKRGGNVVYSDEIFTNVAVGGASETMSGLLKKNYDHFRIMRNNFGYGVALGIVPLKVAKQLVLYGMYHLGIKHKI